MANTLSASKRVRQTAARTAENRTMKSQVKTSRRRLQTALETGDAKAAKEAYASFISTVDHAVNKGVMHRNASSRLKSTYSRRLSEGSPS